MVLPMSSHLLRVCSAKFQSFRAHTWTKQFERKVYHVVVFICFSRSLKNVGVTSGYTGKFSRNLGTVRTVIA